MRDDSERCDGAGTVPEDSPPDGVPAREVLEIDHVYEALGHPRRRYLCYTLLEEEEEWSLSDLATKVAAWENGVPEHAVSDRQRDRVYVSLYHAHVPKLVDEGVVTFDAARERIAAAENIQQVLAALQGIGASLDANQEAHARSSIDDDGT